MEELVIPCFMVSLFLFGAGLLFICTPARRLLQWDRKTGYWFYRQEMKRSGDEEKAIASAQNAYKAYGWLAIILGAIHAFVGTALLLSAT